MQARMKNPGQIPPDAIRPILALRAIPEKAGLPATTHGLVHLRASQINGCSFCVDSGVKHARKAGEKEERLATVAA
jgi:AhpD family alkylhydroperoxidase